jgi:hypothetical protein
MEGDEMKFHAGKWILGGVVFGIITWIIGMLFGAASGGLYTGPIWRAMTGAGFWSLIFVVHIIGGLLFALMYAFLHRGVPCRSGVAKGAFFGFLIFIGATLLGLAMTYAFVNIGILIILLWAISSLVSYVVAGLALGAIYNKV